MEGSVLEDWEGSKFPRVHPIDIYSLSKKYTIWRDIVRVKKRKRGRGEERKRREEK